MDLNITSIVGTRPNLLKVSALCKRLDEEFNHKIVNTGQHFNYEMDKIFYPREPDLNLHVKPYSEGYQIGEIIKKSEEALQDFHTDLTLVYGDTNSTLGGALASSKLKIKLAHIEAGVRSKDRTLPEEQNRIMVDIISDYHFCPNRKAMQNLIAEGNLTKNSHTTGDVMVDLFDETYQDREILKELSLDRKEYFLVTIHRQNNTDIKENLQNIISWIRDEERAILVSHHRNLKMLQKFQMLETIKDRIIPATTYEKFLALEASAKAIVTDSGGVQKEAYMSQTPCLVLRDSTEWTEPIEDKWAKLSDTKEIKQNLDELLAMKNRTDTNSYSKGVENIIKILREA